MSDDLWVWDAVRLVVFVVAVGLVSAWVRGLAWSVEEWWAGRQAGYARPRAFWRALVQSSQIALVCIAVTENVVRVGRAPTAYLPVNLVVLSVGLVGTWQLARYPKRRQDVR